MATSEERERPDNFRWDSHWEIIASFAFYHDMLWCILYHLSFCFELSQGWNLLRKAMICLGYYWEGHMSISCPFQSELSSLLTILCPPLQKKSWVWVRGKRPSRDDILKWSRNAEECSFYGDRLHAILFYQFISGRIRIYFDRKLRNDANWMLRPAVVLGRGSGGCSEFIMIRTRGTFRRLHQFSSIYLLETTLMTRRPTICLSITSRSGIIINIV